MVGYLNICKGYTMLYYKMVQPVLLEQGII